MPRIYRRTAISPGRKYSHATAIQTRTRSRHYLQNSHCGMSVVIKFKNRILGDSTVDQYMSIIKYLLCIKKIHN